MHRVEILDISEENIVFHDPSNNNPRPARKESIELFKKAWLDALESPELCVYKKYNNSIIKGNNMKKNNKKDDLVALYERMEDRVEDTLLATLTKLAKERKKKK